MNTITKLEAIPEHARPHLEHVPEHIVHEFGGLALQLTHEERHPTVERQTPSGNIISETDFNRVITDPDEEAAQYSDEAREAAERGDKKVSELLGSAAQVIGRAHEALTAESVQFGSDELESNNERDRRESKEHDVLYKKAYELIIEQANTLKESGDSEGAAEALETLVLMASTNQWEHRAFQDVVHAGLHEELINALHNTVKLVKTEERDDGTKAYGDRVAPYGQTRLGKLLELASGKRLTSDWEESDSQGASDRIYLHSLDEWTDGFAVASMPNAKLSIQDIVRIVGSQPGWLDTMMKRGATAQELYDVSMGLLDAGPPTEFYRGDFSDYLDFSDPLYVRQAEELLGMDKYQIKEWFGEVTDQRLIVIDKERIDQHLALKEKHPDLYAFMAEFRYQPEVSAEELSRRYELATSLGLVLSHEIKFEIVKSADEHFFDDTCQMLSEYFASAGVAPSEISEMDKVFGSIYGESAVRYMFRNEDRAEVRQLIEMYKPSKETFDAYRDHYENLPIPVKKPDVKAIKVSLESLPEFSRKFESIGIPHEVAKEMFESWATYSAYFKEYQDKLPTDALPDFHINKVAVEQSKALRKQFQAVESFVKTEGIETTLDIIHNFGIYNFARHTPEQLKQQLELWQSGESVKDIVVESRSDWNTFTGKPVEFEDKTRQPVFFEANSATDIARVAVQVGRREREQGRTPSIDNFVIHAHGNPSVMAMGVNGEMIDVAQYREVSERPDSAPKVTANNFRRHLGDHFRVILQSCSTAGDNGDFDNLAESMSRQHDVEVAAYGDTIFGVVIEADGKVKFKTDKGDGEAVIYDRE